METPRSVAEAPAAAPEAAPAEAPAPAPKKNTPTRDWARKPLLDHRIRSRTTGRVRLLNDLLPCARWTPSRGASVAGRLCCSSSNCACDPGGDPPRWEPLKPRLHLLMFGEACWGLKNGATGRRAIAADVETLTENLRKRARRVPTWSSSKTVGASSVQIAANF